MADFIPQRDIQALSHLNVVDDIAVATEFYLSVLGFEEAANADGPMDYPDVHLASFARNAGFDDGQVSLHVRFLKHPEVGIYLELFNYQHPKGEPDHPPQNDKRSGRHSSRGARSGRRRGVP